MVSIAQASAGLMKYGQQHMMPKMDSKGQFFLGMGLGVATRRAEELLKNSSFIAAAGYVKDNQVDLDLLYSDAAAQMKRQGQLVWDVPMLGKLTFTEQDLRDLRQCILGE